MNIWNIGDDSMDYDEGWRGKAQFILIVQGYSVDAARGSGVGDNCMEMDGAEDADWQPVSTTCIYNVTAIGQPLSARKGEAFRDGCRAQVRNSIFMDIGQEVVKNDGSDGDGANGYGFNGTLTFDEVWATDYTEFSTVNAPANPADFYRSQTSGKLADVLDTVYFRNQYISGTLDAYSTANSVNVFDAANNNTIILGTADADSPIQALSRSGPVTKGGLTLLPVTHLDPRPNHEALTSVGYAPEDGFFSSARYSGAFAPGNSWLHGWTACEAFGFTSPDAWYDLGTGHAGTTGDPILSGTGDLSGGSNVSLTLTNAFPNSLSLFVVGLTEKDLVFKGATIVPSLDFFFFLPTDGSGSVSVNGTFANGVPSGTEVFFQFAVVDPGAEHFGPNAGIAASNALVATTP